MRTIALSKKKLEQFIYYPGELLGVALVILAIFLVSSVHAEQAVNVQVKNPGAERSDAWRDNPWNPFAEMVEIQSRIHQMFEDSMRNFPQSGGMTAKGSFEGAVAPAIDLMEAPAEFVVTCDVPGIPKENIVVEVDGSVLSVRGERRQERSDEKAEKGYRMLFQERGYGAFERSIRLPESADTTRITASYDNGQLSIRIPKLPEKQPVKVQIV